jgi:hypothetical protein
MVLPVIIVPCIIVGLPCIIGGGLYMTFGTDDVDAPGDPGAGVGLGVTLGAGPGAGPAPGTAPQLGHAPPAQPPPIQPEVIIGGAQPP